MGYEEEEQKEEEGEAEEEGASIFYRVSREFLKAVNNESRPG